MKAYTDVEQSKKLAEILQIDSADLWWTIIQPKKYEGWELVNDGESFTTLSFAKQEHIALASYKEIPAWSLNALLNILPSSTLDSSDDHHYRVHCRERFTEWHDNAIDSCVEMIVKLHEKGLL